MKATKGAKGIWRSLIVLALTVSMLAAMPFAIGLAEEGDLAEAADPVIVEESGEAEVLAADEGEAVVYADPCEHEPGPWQSWLDSSDGSFGHYRRCIICNEWIEEADCTFSDGYCTECGRKEICATHTFDRWYRWIDTDSGESYHQRFCIVCENSFDYGKCTFANGVCTVCGSVEPCATHTFNRWNRWFNEYDGVTYHDRYCSVCENWFDYGECTFANGVCTVCGGNEPCAPGSHTFSTNDGWGHWRDDDGEWVHSFTCAVCGLWIRENCTPDDDGICTVCGGETVPLCPDGQHNYILSNWRDSVSGDIGHDYWCDKCYDVYGGYCTYAEGSTVCIVCGYDARICLACGGTGILRCGDNADCGIWGFDDYEGINCPNYVLVAVPGDGGDVYIGYCGCGCEIYENWAQYEIAAALAGDSWVNTWGAGNIWRLQCGNECDCACVWNCPVCGGPLQTRTTTRVAPKMGDSSGSDMTVWITTGAVFTLLAGSMAAVVISRRAKNKQ